MKRPINIKHVAQAAGVSAMTVSRYFNQPSKLSSETLTRVEAAIHQLNYVPNNAARTLLRGNSETLAFIGHFAHHFDYSIFSGIEDWVYEYNYLLFLCNTSHHSNKFRYVNRFYQVIKCSHAYSINSILIVCCGKNEIEVFFF